MMMNLTYWVSTLHKVFVLLEHQFHLTTAQCTALWGGGGGGVGSQNNLILRAIFFSLYNERGTYYISPFCSGREKLAWEQRYC